MRINEVHLLLLLLLLLLLAPQVTGPTGVITRQQTS